MNNNSIFVINQTELVVTSSPGENELIIKLILNIRLIIFGYVMLPLAICGVLLNGFTIVVLLHPRMRVSSTNAYLTALSIANIVCLFDAIFQYSIRYLMFTLYDINNSYEQFYNLTISYWSPISLTFQLYAIYMTCAVTVDRWIYLKWPLKVDKICTMTNTIRLIVSIFIFCFIYNLPNWFTVIINFEFKFHFFSKIIFFFSKTQSKELWDNELNETYYVFESTQFAINNTIYKYGYTIIGYWVFVFGLPFGILLAVNILIVIKLIETKKRRNNLMGASQKRRTTQTTFNNNSKIDPMITLMILAIVFVFFLCQFPYFLLHMVRYVSGDKIWFKIAKTFADLLISFNCCINFVIYCFFGQNFRRIAHSILFHPSLTPYKNINRFTNYQSTVAKKSTIVVSTGNEVLSRI
jgi:hypothetical protein